MRSLTRTRLASLSGPAGASTTADPFSAARSSATAPLCLLLLAMMTAGCMVSPRYGEELASRSTKILVSGTTPYPGEKLTIVASCRAGKEFSKTTFAGLQPVITDVSGQKWYGYSETVVVPNDMWCSVTPGTTRYTTNLYVKGGSSLTHFGFFDQDAWVWGGVSLEACADANMSGVDIVLACAARTGVALYATGP